MVEGEVEILKPVGIFQKALNRIGYVSKKNYIIGAEKAKTLPTPLETFIKLAGNVEKTGITQFSYQYLRDLAYSSDVVTLIVRTLTAEGFRNGIDVKERFKSKCTGCGREFEEIEPLCPYCSAICRLPDYEDWKRLMAFLRKTNKFDDTPLRTMMQVDTDVNILDNGWILLYRTYIYDENGNIIDSPVKEMVRMDADKMRLIMSNYGMGYDDMGNPAYFCPSHREEVKLKPEPKSDYRCDKCKGIMLPAWYMAKVGAIQIYYSPDEIYHVKRWASSQGYGVSPLISCWMKINVLLRMDRFILDAYSLQRSPQQLLILRGKADSIHKAWQFLMQKARENPNMIYPLVIEDTGDSRKRIIESEKFELKPVEWAWKDMRDEFNRKIGAVYGVQPLFLQGAEGGGLNNEGLMIAATNRTIMMGQAVWNSYLEWLGRQLGAKDYVMRLEPNEQEDKLRDMDIESKRIAVAQAMASLGWEGELHSDMSGRIEFSYRKQRKKPEEVKPPKESTEAPDEMNPPLQAQKANYQSRPIKYRGRMKTGAEDATTNGSSGGESTDNVLQEW